MEDIDAGRIVQSLKSVNVGDDQATIVVAQLEDYIVRKVEDANKEIKAKLDVLMWMIGSIGAIIAILTLVVPAIKLFTH